VSRKPVSAIMFILLLMSMLTLAFNIQPVEASGTIYIRADGSIDPPTAPIFTVNDVTYTLTGNITSDNDGLMIERNHIIIEGSGFTLARAQAAGGPPSGNATGINLASFGENVTIRNIQIENFSWGIKLSDSCKYNNINGNNLTKNFYGIWLGYSSNNSISGNRIIGQTTYGIWLTHSSNNSISGNSITNNYFGIPLEPFSNYNSITGNNIADNYYGLRLYECSYNNISGNNMTGNGFFGFSITQRSNYNVIYHNNFIGNAHQIVKHEGSGNTWDDSYPSGGNYLSDYNGEDLYRGSYQNETGSDGIGDTPYIIDADNRDRYPLMQPYVPFENQTIYIRADGRVDPSGAPIRRVGELYTLIGDISSVADGIVIEKDNITLGGAGYTLQGGGDGVGVILSGRSNITIENAMIKSFGYGISLLNSSYDKIIGNGVTANSDGGIVFGNFSCYNTISKNNITDNACGIELGESSNNSISGNKIENNTLGIMLYSDCNDIIGNDITDNSDGVCLWGSSNNKLIENNIETSDGRGIFLDDFNYNNSICRNNVTSNAQGIKIGGSVNSNNSISENNVASNGEGISFDLYSSGNSVCHNNFVNNTSQVFKNSGAWNVWDDGYPSGGNYWSDYNGTDLYHGPYQNETGSDGIGDVPYVVDEINQDNYPFMKAFPWDQHDVAVTMASVSKTVCGQGYTMRVNAMVFNYGENTETFNVTAYANETIPIEMVSLELTSRTSLTVNFTWNTTGFAYGNYTLSAHVPSVPGETNTANNNFTGGWIIVSMVGDITGPDGWPDGKVDMYDVGNVARAFMATYNSSDGMYWHGVACSVCPHSPNFDINNDGKIDMKDIGTVARHFGEHV